MVCPVNRRRLTIMAETERKEAIRAFAPAKINLFLHVLGKRADGYHDLESLVTFADVGDHLTAVPADKWGLSLTGPFADGLRGYDPDDNLILRAAHLASEWARAEGLTLSPLHFTLEKHLPVASGIGGGSADAAAALHLCGKAAGFAVISRAQYDAAAVLGADVPACLYSKPTWMTGTGAALRPAVMTSRFALLLVNPGVPVSTAEVFNTLGSLSPRTPRSDFPNFLTLGDLVTFLKDTTNDLEAPARAIAPVIGTVIEEIAATSPLLARMSGSGATCFGLYASAEEAQKAAAAIRAAHHDWWLMCG